MKAEDYYKDKHGDSQWLNKEAAIQFAKDYADKRFELYEKMKADFKLYEFNQRLRGIDRKDGEEHKP